MHLGYWADFGKQHGVGKLSARRKMNALECAGLPVKMISLRRKEKKTNGLDDLERVFHRDGGDECRQ